MPSISTTKLSKIKRSIKNMLKLRATRLVGSNQLIDLWQIRVAANSKLWGLTCVRSDTLRCWSRFRVGECTEWSVTVNRVWISFCRKAKNNWATLTITLGFFPKSQLPQRTSPKGSAWRCSAERVSFLSQESKWLCHSLVWREVYACSAFAQPHFK